MKTMEMVAAMTSCWITRAHGPAPRAAAPTAHAVATIEAVTPAPWITPKLIDRVRSALLAEPVETRNRVSPPAMSRGATSGSPRTIAAG